MSNYSRWKKMSEAERWKEYVTLNLKERGEFLDFIQTENYRRKEHEAIKTHKQPCNCLDCIVHKQRSRKEHQRPPHLYPR